MTTQIEDFEQLLVEDANAEAMASDQHGEIGAIIIAALVNFVYPRKLGRVFNVQTSFKLNDNQPSRMPDAAFVKMERLPGLKDEDISFAPDLAVEIISRNDDWSQVVRKAETYLQAGSALVWVVDPYGQNVFVFQANQHMLMLTPPDELDGAGILPGFKLKISEIFV